MTKNSFKQGNGDIEGTGTENQAKYTKYTLKINNASTVSNFNIILTQFCCPFNNQLLI